MPFEGGMPGGFNMGGMPGKTRSFHFSTGGGGGNGGFSFSSPDDMFNRFFKQGGAGLGDDDDIFQSFAGGGMGGLGGMGGMGGMGGSSPGFGGSRGSRFRQAEARERASTPEATIVEKPLEVTLEQLFTGMKKKLKIKRKTLDNTTGKRKMEEKVLEIDVKSGYKAGTKITFRGWGDQNEEGSQDLQFVITEVSSMHR